MTQFVVDAALRSKLHNLTQPLEICDEAGNVVGHILPVVDPPESEELEPPPAFGADIQ